MESNLFSTDIKKMIFIIMLFTSVITSFGQYNNEYLRSQNVKQFGATYNQSIDTILIDVIPRGLNTEINIYFNFSTRGNNINNSDSLEIQMMFKLPPKAEVTDMSLWIGDSIVKARVMDRWTASQIYEEIVRRRVDPAILYKERIFNWQTNTYRFNDLYTFRIFPLMKQLNRKAKITYLIPNSSFYAGKAIIPLPLNILKLSYLPINYCKLRVHSNNFFSNPSIIERSDINFNYNSSQDYYEAVLNNFTSLSNLSLEINVPNQAIFAGQYSGISENYYQIQIIPNSVFGLSKNKKILFLVDYVSDSQTAGNESINTLKQSIHEYLTINDSFNLVLSGYDNTYASSTWVPADSISIENVFSQLSSYQFSNTSFLPYLLFDGIDYAQQNGNNCTMALVSNSETHGDYHVANSIINECIAMMGNHKIPIHIIDLNENNTGFYTNGHFYVGNEYLYIQLSLQTSGEFNSIRSSNYHEMLSLIYQYTSGYFENFDLYVTTENGYTYANYNYNSNGSSVYYNQPIQRIGKYTGNGRMNVVISAQNYNGDIYQSQFFIEPENIFSLDSVAKQSWAALYVKELYGSTQTNAVINNIINTSIRERVLCDYTAFLALEPDYNIPNANEGGVTSITENFNDKILFKLYPNPAQNYIVLSIDLPFDSDIVVELFDLTGRMVAIRNINRQPSGNSNITIDIAEIPNGIYLCNVKLNSKSVGKSKITIIK